MRSTLTGLGLSMALLAVPAQAAESAAAMRATRPTDKPLSKTIPPLAGTTAIAETLLSLLPRQTGATDKSKTGEVADAHS